MFTDDELRVLRWMSTYKRCKWIYASAIYGGTFLDGVTTWRTMQEKSSREQKAKKILAGITAKVPQLILVKECNQFALNLPWLLEQFLAEPPARCLDAAQYIECLEKAGMI